MANRKPVVERGSWSVTEFQARHALSAPTWRKLVATGRAPKITLLGGKLRRISYIAEIEWLKAMETASPQIQHEVDSHKARMLAAQAKGVRHPDNICNRRNAAKSGVGK